MGEDRLANRASELFSAWDSYLSTTLPLSDYYLRFELAEGSLKGHGKVAAAAVALYMGIASFGSFVSGVHEIAKISRTAGDFLIREADDFLKSDRRGPVRGRKTAAQLAQLETLFVQVKRGDLSPMEATALADRLFESEKPLPVGFRSELHTAIRDIPRRAKQLGLELEYSTATADDTGLSEPERKRERRVPPIPPIPVPTRFRVEVWRESKKDRRHIHIEPI